MRLRRTTVGAGSGPDAHASSARVQWSVLLTSRQISVIRRMENI